MKNKLVGLAVAGALVAAGAVQAQPFTPSSGTAATTDLWLFVENATTSQTIAVDTGQSMSSLLSSFTANANLKPVFDSFSAPATAALSSFMNTADTLNWAVEGLTSPGGEPTQTPGQTIGIASASSAVGSGFAGMNFGGLKAWYAGYQTDSGYVIFGNGGTVLPYTTGGSTYAWANGNSSGQVWGGPPGGSSAGSTIIYGQAAGVGQTGFTPGTSETLYAVTANNGLTNSSALQSYILGTITLATLANGAALTLVAPSAVPLPAALWLLGGGLLGLAGVGRRRTAAV